MRLAAAACALAIAAGAVLRVLVGYLDRPGDKRILRLLLGVWMGANVRFSCAYPVLLTVFMDESAPDFQYF